MDSPFKQQQTIAITGATGFLGTHLTESLLNKNQRVNILARNRDRAKIFEGRVNKIVVGDIADPVPIKELVDGCDLVYHLASNYRTAADPPRKSYKINVEGTRNTFLRSQEAQVKRFVHCSTIGVYGDIIDVPTTENSPFNPGDTYQKTKLEGEQFVTNQIETSKMEIVVIRPCSQYGPGDMRMLKMFKMLAKRRFFLLGKCDANFHAVYIDDLVNAFVLAGTHPNAAGESFIIGHNEYHPLHEYIATAAQAVGQPPPYLKFPYTPFLWASKVVEAVCIPLGLEPPIHPRRIKFYKNNRAFDVEKASRLMAFNPTINLTQGMKSTILWYQNHDHI